MRYIYRGTKNYKKFSKKIVDEIENILANCELYNPETDTVRVEELSKLRKWEIHEVIGNYFNKLERDEHLEETEWTDIKRLSTFCKTFEIEENEVAYYYARGIAEVGYSLAYAINENMVLIIE